MLDINSYLETANWATEGDEGMEDAFTSEDYLQNLEKELKQFWEKSHHLFTEDEIENDAIEHDFS